MPARPPLLPSKFSDYRCSKPPSVAVLAPLCHSHARCATPVSNDGSQCSRYRLSAVSVTRKRLVKCDCRIKQASARVTETKAITSIGNYTYHRPWHSHLNGDCNVGPVIVPQRASSSPSIRSIRLGTAEAPTQRSLLMVMTGSENHPFAYRPSPVRTRPIPNSVPPDDETESLNPPR